MTDLRDCVRGDTEFVNLWNRVCDEEESKHRRWISNLRKCGVIAAHPDDGWVNREENSLRLCYPQFDDGISIGSVVALGWNDKYRLVKITGRKKGRLGLETWFFQESDEL